MAESWQCLRFGEGTGAFNRAFRTLAHRQVAGLGGDAREAADFLSSCNFLKFDLRDSDKSERLRSFLDLTVGPEYPHSKRADSRRMFRRLKKNIRRKVLGR